MIRVSTLLLLAGCITTACGAEFHVAVEGKDTNTGAEDSPFGTLEGARDAIRAMKQAGGLPEGGVTVWVHGGEYARKETFALTEGDSGAADRPVVYRARTGELVRLSGGMVLPAAAFAPLADAPGAERIDAEARPHVICADLKALGVAEYGTYPDQFIEPPNIPELFCDDQRMTLARWPNEGWAEIAKVVESGPAPWRNHASDKPGTFEYSGNRPERWTSSPGVWLHGYWCFDWASDTIRVAKIDPASKQITLGTNHGYGIGSGNPAPRRYRAVNVLEELDQADEYFLDREPGRLYFWPPGDIAKAHIVLSTLSTPVIALENAAHVTFQGFTIEACRGTGVEIKGGQNCRLAACAVRNTGLDAIVIDGGEKHTVIACDIHDTGTGGVTIGGGDRKTLTPCGHEAINNHIWNVSRRRPTHAYHFQISGVGVHLVHNRLHDAPHQSIGVAGNDHLIELNEVFRSGMDSDDCGAFYMGRNPSERGTVIRHNFWHDIGSNFAHGSCAIYFDDGSGGQTVEGNLFLRASGGQFGAVFIHGGHDNRVENNIFIDCTRAMGHVPWNDPSWNEWLAGDLWKTRLLEEVDITKPPYIERYPQLQGFLEPVSKPRMNHAARNLIVHCKETSTGNWSLKDNWILDADPGFADAARNRAVLSDDVPLWQQAKGIKAIPFHEIGLYTDELRPVLPE